MLPWSSVLHGGIGTASQRMRSLSIGCLQYY